MIGVSPSPEALLHMGTESPEFDKPREACGVVAVISLARNAGKIACMGITVLENRGRDATGVAVFNDEKIFVDKDFGVGKLVFPDGGASLNNAHRSLQALAHARYATQGTSEYNAIQPHDNMHPVPHAHVHNGNLTNKDELAAELGVSADDFASDSELMTFAFAVEVKLQQETYPDQPINLKQIVAKTLRRFKGAFTGALMVEGEIVAYCDPNGLKPAVIGRLPDGGMMVASEVTALDVNKAALVREMQPGELISLKTDGTWTAKQWAVKTEAAGCLMELVYFMKLRGENGTEASFRNVNIAEVRHAVGRELAGVQPVESDLVFGVENSAVPAGKGYAEASGIPYQQGLKANTDAKTFIGSTQELRRQAVRAKHQAIPEIVAGKKIIVVEDSLVRGTTMREVVAMLKEAGAKEVHVRIALDKYKYTCELGVNTGNTKELLAANMTEDDIREYIGADSLAFLPVEKIKVALGKMAGRFCMGCLTGKYPTDKPVNLSDKKELLPV